jgi:hypothetical protein
VTQKVHFGKPREHADVEQRSAEPTAREGKPDLADECAAQSRVRAKELVEDTRGFRAAGVGRRGRARLLELVKSSELEGGAAELPVRHAGQCLRLLQPLPRLAVFVAAKERLGHGDEIPPVGSEIPL